MKIEDELLAKKHKKIGICFKVSELEHTNMTTAARANSLSLAEYLRNLHRLHVQSHITYHPAGGPLLRASRTLMIEAKRIVSLASDAGQRLKDLEMAITDLEIALQPFE